ncbi:hypothetical protein AB832_01715 [Flavobacteriaceae bacterium (ex Bugula neritina AB1)]|nr:hypothetical protein AB832_01715 [Flavobacteriaceae bacterium (ex Bugula neritina AB1)]
MKSKDKNKAYINNLVLEGKAPVAFYNSQIVDLTTNRENSNIIIKEKKLIPKYKQVSIPRPNSNKNISKIYDLF